MATDLRAAVNSEFINASMLTRPKASLPIMHVYVEDDIDKLFWRTFLNEEITQCRVCISVYKVANKEMRGKDAMMMDVVTGNLVPNDKMLVCVDADLDLLIDDYHKYTNVLRSNPYVITTKWYAIENLKCSPKNILKMLYRLTLEDEISINVEEKLAKVYSELAFLFWLVLVSIDLRDGCFTLDSFRILLNKIQFEDSGEISRNSLLEISSYKSAVSSYYATHKKEVMSMQKKLSVMGYTDKNLFQVMRGHDIANIVTKRFLKKVSQEMRKRKLSQLGGNEANPEYKKQLQQQYANCTGVNKECGLGHRIDQLIVDCTDFVGLPVYEDIQNQIKQALVYGKVSSIVEGIRFAKTLPATL